MQLNPSSLLELAGYSPPEAHLFREAASSSAVVLPDAVNRAVHALHRMWRRMCVAARRRDPASYVEPPVRAWTLADVLRVVGAGHLGLDATVIVSLCKAGLGFPADVFAAGIVGVLLFSGVPESQLLYEPGGRSVLYFRERRGFTAARAAATAELCRRRHAADDDASRAEDDALVDLLSRMLHPDPAVRSEYRPPEMFSRRL